MENNYSWSEVLQAALTPILKTLEQFNEQVRKHIAAEMSRIYRSLKDNYKAFNISNMLVKELITEEEKEICIITTEQFDIDNIITTLEFIELCKRANKEVKHRALLSYKDNTLKLSSSLKDRDLSEISFYALDCECRLSKYNAYNIHNHLNELAFDKYNISANCFLYNKYKSYNHITDMKQGISTAMSVISSSTSAERVEFISKADSCGYSIFLNKYAADRGFKYEQLFEQEKSKYSCYNEFKKQVQQLKNNINYHFCNSYKDNYYTLKEQDIENCRLSAAELQIMREYAAFMSGEYYIAEHLKSKKADINIISKGVAEIVEEELQKLDISREEVVNISFIEITEGERYLRIQYLIDEQKQKERERAKLAEMLANMF